MRGLLGPAISGMYKVRFGMTGGEGGIRTHGTIASTTVFETAPFDHSGTSPHVWSWRSTLLCQLIGADVRTVSRCGQARANLRLWRAVPGGVKGHSVVDSLGQKR